MSESKSMCGAIPSIVDERDYAITSLISCTPRLPDRYQTEIPCTVWDQGQSSECVASSLALIRFLQEYNQSNNRSPFSPSYVYSNREPDMYQGEGMYPREALKIIQKYGIAPFEDFPGFFTYEEAVKRYQEKKEKLDLKAFPFRVSSYYAVSGVVEIKNTVMKLQAVSAMFPVYETLYYPDSSGTIKYDNEGLKNIKIDGYHQMTIVGWTDDNHWIVQNSWGVGYGLCGLCYIPMEYPIVEAWTAVDSITEIQFMNEV